jgi:hypothetical protein
VLVLDRQVTGLVSQNGRLLPIFQFFSHKGVNGVGVARDTLEAAVRQAEM